MEETGNYPGIKETMQKFFSMLKKANLPYLWLIGYLAVSMVLANTGVQVTEYTAEMFAGNVSFTGVILPFLLYSLLSLGISSISGIASGLCTARIDRNLRRSLWDSMVRLPFAFYQDSRPKEMISRITTDVTAVSQLVMQVFLEFITTLYASALILGKIYSYDLKLMLTLLVILPLQIVIAWIAGQLQFGLGNEVNQKQADLTQGIAERTGQSLLIKSFGTQAKEEKQIGAQMKRLYRASIRNAWANSMVSPFYTVAAAIQFILLVLVGRDFYSKGAISLAQWVAFFAFANQLINILTTYTGYWTSLRAAQGSTLRISDIMALPKEELLSGKDADGLTGDIVFCDVSFGFGGKPLFDRLNLTIPEGKMTAVIGASGSGKTTLLNLLHRLYPLDGGSISIGGQDIESFSKKSCRALLTYITQEAVLFSGTIRENLVAGLSREIEEKELDEICSSLGLTDFIRSLPLLYDTVIEENGANFSGGQCQKLAIVRACLNASDYLLIDEGTAALDASAKDLIWNAVKERMAGKTVVYVTHSKQAVLHADYVIVLNQGQVEGQGPLEEMMAKNTYFQEFIKEDSHEKE